MSVPAATHVIVAADPAEHSQNGRQSTGSVLSRDGTVIGYRQLGHGPGLVVVHGSMSSGTNHTELASFLADDFTVVLPDRHGRGLSGPHANHHGLATEVDDLVAVLEATGARRLFGISSGAIIALETALTHGGLDRVAVFEPPIVRDPAWVASALGRLDRELAQGRRAAALVTAMLAAQMGPRLLGYIPRRLMEFLTNRYMAGQDANGSGEYVPMRSLAPLLRYDFALIVEMGGKAARFKALEPEVLLLGSSRSPAYLKQALGDLEQTIPRVRRVELPGLDHAASWNSDIGGRPEPVARAVRSFFA
jgi:pimeloyl-ACP methyl ester carboxylesterase